MQAEVTSGGGERQEVMDIVSSKRVVFVTVPAALAPAAPFVAVADLTSSRGDAPSGAGGTAVAVLAGPRLVIAGLYHGLDGAPGRAAVRGEAARDPLTLAVRGGGSGTFSGAFASSKKHVQDLTAERATLRLAAAHPGGELSGRFGAARGVRIAADGVVGVWSPEACSGSLCSLENGHWTVLAVLEAAGGAPAVGHTRRLEGHGLATIVYGELPYAAGRRRALTPTPPSATLEDDLPFGSPQPGAQPGG